MNALRLALALWARDGIISLVAFAGWPRWRWASKAGEGLRERQGVRV